MTFPSEFLRNMGFCPKCGDEINSYLTKEEIKILYDHFSHEFITYENEPLIEVMKKIAEIANAV